MKVFFYRINNQDGSMIVVAMMLLAILTIIGITSTNTTVVENRIAVNDQLHRIAFYHADSGVYGTAKLISASIDDSSPVSDGDYEFEYQEDSNPDGKDFYEQVTGQADYDDGRADISYELEGGEIMTDIEHIGTSTGGASGGAVFGRAGRLGQGEVTLYMRIFSEGTGPRDSVKTISGVYRKVLGQTEGL